MPRKVPQVGCVRCIQYKPKYAFELGAVAASALKRTACHRPRSMPDGPPPSVLPIWHIDPARKRMDVVCLECRERERIDKLIRREKYTSTKEIEGVLSRRCSRCHTWKPLTLEFFYKTRIMRNGSIDFDYWCRVCQCARVSERQKRRRQDPASAERERQITNERTKRWRRKNPEAARAAARRYKERVKADPQRHARQLELDRINYRLRKERKGQQIRQTKKPLKAKNGFQPGTRRLDATPLREWVDSVMEFEKRLSDADMTAVASMLEVDQRRLLVIRNGEYQKITLAAAERMLTRYGRPMRVNGFGLVESVEDLWPELQQKDAA